MELQRPDGDWLAAGVLQRVDNTNWFESLDSYWAAPRRPTLGQIFEERGRDWKPNAHVGLPRWFSHLLPEGGLRRAVSLASGINQDRELQLLVRIGADDLPGAIRVLPARMEGGEYVPTVEPENLEAEAEDPILKFSLAGLQMKFSIHESDRGLTVPLSGSAGNAILKTPFQQAGYVGVPEAEFAVMTLARNAGIEVPDVKLVDASQVAGLDEWARLPGQALLIQRYDRRDPNLRVHAEEFAQVLDIPTGRVEMSRYKRANFETVANIAAKLDGVEAVAEVIKRIVLNVLAGNGDAHLKNWSFVYPDGAHPRISPAYDLVPTVLFMANEDLGLKLDGSKRFVDVTASSFERLGDRTGFGATAARKVATDAVDRIMEEWRVMADILPRAQMDALDRHRASLSL